MCAGAIDGTHIPIIAPSINHTEYVNRKGYNSIVMQAVVDCNYLYRDVVILVGQEAYMTHVCFPIQLSI